MCEIYFRPSNLFQIFVNLSFFILEVISEGEARLTYKPKDNRFLNLRKGDVVFVKSKDAGAKQTLWGGEVWMDFILNCL